MPNSVLWVFLIVVWLFVLVPMVLRGRPAARTSTKAAAQTRVVHRGGSRSAASRRAATQARSERAASAAKRLAERRAAEKKAAEKKAAEKKAAEEKAAEKKAESEKIVETEVVETEVVETEVAETEVDEAVDTVDAEVVDAEVVEAEVVEADAENDTESADTDVADAEEEAIDAEIVEDVDAEESPTVLRADAESPLEVTDVFDVVDVDVVDLDEAQAARVDPLVGEDEAELDDDLDDGEFEDEDGAADGFDILDDDSDEYDSDEYDSGEYEVDDEYDDETDAAEPEEEAAPKPKPRELRGRGGLAPGHVQEREEAAYRERRRILAALSLLTVASIVSAFFVQPLGYVAVGVVVVVFAAYLFFLRRTVRIEHQRHAQRRARQRRREVEDARIRREQAEPLYVAPPARLRRPGGAIVLEIDDEDPAFDHLPTYDFSGVYRHDDTDLDAELGEHRAAV